MGMYMQNKFEFAHDIIKYNTRRQYFGSWTPYKLHKTYRDIHENPFNPIVYMETGVLSTENVCDVIWNEMSYNPLRFGETNPFLIENIDGMKEFCKKYKANASYVMQQLSQDVGYFLYFIGKSNPEFHKTNHINCGSILINCDKNRNAGYGYYALSSLVDCVHHIATQNLKDFKIKKYREQIVDVAQSRHPNLKRSNEYLNFVEIDKLKTSVDGLYDAITAKDSDIMDTRAHIKTLNEYDPPVDSSHEQSLLEKQTQDLQTLEEYYAFVKNKYDKLIARKNEIEK